MKENQKSRGLGGVLMRQKCIGVLVVMRQKWKRVHMYTKKGFKDKNLLGWGGGG